MPLIVLMMLGSRVKFALDTGAEANIMDEDTYGKLAIKPRLTPTKTRLYAYGSGNPIPALGQFTTRVATTDAIAGGGCYHKVTFIVTKGGHGNLLSYASAIDLGVMQRIGNVQANVPTVEHDLLVGQLSRQYPNLFSGHVGRLHGHRVRLHIDTSVRPVQQRFRPVPFHLQEAVEREIKQMLAEDIIEPVTGPTPWVSPIVPVPKPGKPGQLRICTDNRMSNKAIRPSRHSCPTLDDVTVRLNGAAVISKLDLKAAFQQLVIERESRYITTFCTHVGIFRYKRLNFGINTASHELQRAIENVLSGLGGCFNMADDVLVYGRDQKQHDEHLHAVLQRLETSGLTLNVPKCLFGQSEMDFFGIHISAEGISITAEKHAALRDAAPPTTASELRSLLGLASYCSRFIPDLSTIVEPLRELTKHGVGWQWEAKHDQAVKELKEAIITSTLEYFRKDWSTVVTVDASPVGLGCVLAQHPRGYPDQHKVVLNLSRALSPVERRYSQVEREALAVVWACERLHFYLYGCDSFELRTDNKAIQLIFGNPQSKPKGRIERWALRLLPYRFEVVHTKGSGNIADYLSRNPVADELRQSDHELIAEQYLNFIAEAVRPRAVSRQELRDASATDKDIQEAKHMVADERLPSTGPFKQIRAELLVSNDGLLMRGNRIVIPSQLQNQIVRIAHGGHLGQVKTKQLLRQHVWFSGLDQMVDEAVKSCEQCQVNQPGLKLTPTEASPAPERPWQHLSADFYGPLRSGQYLFVIIDQLSHYPICRAVSSTSAARVLPILRNIFAEFGVPDRVKTDGGPPFNGAAFANFASQEGFKHHRVMPVWAQANGLAERFMRCLGKVMRSAVATGASWEEELEEFLRNYRSTPHSATGVPPADLLFQRTARTTRLPSATISTTEQASPAMAAVNERAKQNELQAKAKMCRYNDQVRNAKESTLQVGDTVYLKNTSPHFKSEPAYEIEPYEIEAINGTMCTVNNGQRRLARHASLLRKRNESDFWSLNSEFQHRVLANPTTQQDGVVADQDEQPTQVEQQTQINEPAVEDDQQAFDTAEESDADMDTGSGALGEQQGDADRSASDNETAEAPRTKRPRREPDRYGFSRPSTSERKSGN
jgi:hypothetical protein